MQCCISVTVCVLVEGNTRNRLDEDDTHSVSPYFDLMAIASHVVLLFLIANACCSAETWFTCVGHMHTRVLSSLQTIRLQQSTGRVCGRRDETTDTLFDGRSEESHY